MQRGKLVGLLGANGIGKSTLLRTLAGMQKALAGQVLLAGDELARLSPLERARRLTLVLTAAPPVGLLNGYALVALGRHPHTDWLGRLGAEDRAAVDWAIGAVNAHELAERPVAELSDGQRQKLMIARALAQESELMLLDEPTAYLDLPRRVETMQLLKRLAQEAERAILVSTHDLDLALRSCDRLWLMSGAGIEVGAPEDLVLAGRLGETFQADGMQFDRSSGLFLLEPGTGPTARVEGNSAEAVWMRRALERAGYVVDGTPDEIEVSPLGNGSSGGWVLRLNGQSSKHASIEAVLDKLERDLG